jgi:hypothetical protein
VISAAAISISLNRAASPTFSIEPDASAPESPPRTRVSCGLSQSVVQDLGVSPIALQLEPVLASSQPRGSRPAVALDGALRHHQAAREVVLPYRGSPRAAWRCSLVGPTSFPPLSSRCRASGPDLPRNPPLADRSSQTHSQISPFILRIQERRESVPESPPKTAPPNRRTSFPSIEVEQVGELPLLTTPAAGSLRQLRRQDLTRLECSCFRRRPVSICCNRLSAAADNGCSVASIDCAARR